LKKKGKGIIEWGLVPRQDFDMHSGFVKIFISDYKIMAAARNLTCNYRINITRHIMFVRRYVISVLTNSERTNILCLVEL
jgi:hypothetical protein